MLRRACLPDTGNVFTSFCVGWRREAEFAAGETVRKYYDRFEEGYLKREFPSGQHRITSANALVGISHYFGIEALFTDSIASPNKTITELGEIFAKGIPVQEG